MGIDNRGDWPTDERKDLFFKLIQHAILSYNLLKV